MGSGFLNQPFLGCPEEEGRPGPWFADYKPSPWSQVVGPRALQSLFSQQRLGSNSFLSTTFQLLGFAGERKECGPACADTYEARGGSMKQERRANSKADLFPCGNNLLVFGFTFTGVGGKGRNITHSGGSSRSENVLCLIDDFHLSHRNS